MNFTFFQLRQRCEFISHLNRQLSLNNSCLIVYTNTGFSYLPLLWLSHLRTLHAAQTSGCHFDNPGKWQLATSVLVVKKLYVRFTEVNFYGLECEITENFVRFPEFGGSGFRRFFLYRIKNKRFGTRKLVRFLEDSGLRESGFRKFHSI